MARLGQGQSNLPSIDADPRPLVTEGVFRVGALLSRQSGEPDRSQNPLALPCLRAILDAVAIPKTRGRFPVHPVSTSSDAQDHRQKPPLFDWLTRFVVPVLSLIMASLEERRELALAFVGFGALVMLLQLAAPSVSWVRRRKRQRNDRITTAHLRPELTRLVERFAGLVNPQSNETLHHILQSVVYPHDPDKLVLLGLPHIRLLETSCRHFTASLDGPTEEPRVLAQRLSDFSDLIADYQGYCVRPVFETFPVELRKALTPDARTALESFREKYVSFREAHEDFEKRAAALLSTVSIRPMYFDRPKPLQQP